VDSKDSNNCAAAWHSSRTEIDPIKLTSFQRSYLDLNYKQFLPIDRSATLLDLGFGSGWVMAYLLEQGFQRIEGVEVDAASVVRLPEALVTRIIIVEDLADFLKGRLEAYDCIIMKNVIAHLHPDRVLEYLQLVRQALKPSGRVIVETFNACRWSGFYILSNDWTHRLSFTEYSLQRLLEAAGFIAVQVRGERHPTSSWRYQGWKLLQRLWELVLRSIFWLERGYDQNPTILSKLLIATATRPVEENLA
jgi:cyclopropane fatty-acyl-phospholipid synthase-like methyltransferase